jgi:hypothetical protein
MKHEWRKTEKAIYLPPDQPTVITLPTYRYIAVKGQGDPNQAAFQHRVEILFSIAYGIKMAPRKGIAIDGYYEYTVYPLEGIWDYSEQAKKNGWTGKEHLVYTIMIRQPSFVNEKLFNRVVTLKKFDDPDNLFDQVELIDHTDGLCVQMMHVGSFDAEPVSFAKMTSFIAEKGLIREDMRHREIYLSDFRSTEQDKLRTVLRVFVQNKE